MKMRFIFASCLLLPSCGDEPGGTFGQSITNNRPPSWQPVGNQSITAEQTLLIRLAAVDPDGDAVQYQALPYGLYDDPFAAANKPQLQRFAGETVATLSWSPTSAEVGRYSLFLSATDDGDPPLSAGEMIVLDVLGTTEPEPEPEPTPPQNQPPTLDVDETFTFAANTDLTVVVTVGDPDDDLVTCSAGHQSALGSDPFQYTSVNDTIAVWQPSSCTFTWSSPTPTQAGIYGVRFCATEDTSEQLATCKDVSIEVTVPVVEDGALVLSEIVFDGGPQAVELTNADIVELDVSGWKIVAAGGAWAFPPGTVLAPGAVVVVHWNASGTNTTTTFFAAGKSPLGATTGLGDTDKSVALYHAESFADAALRDFVQWLEPTQDLETEAESQDLWSVGEFVGESAVGASICRHTLDAYGAAAFGRDDSASLGEPNSGCTP